MAATEGVYYALPRHRLQITADIDRTSTQTTSLMNAVLRVKLAKDPEDNLAKKKELLEWIRLHVGVDLPALLGMKSDAVAALAAREVQEIATKGLTRFKLKGLTAETLVEADPQHVYFVDLRAQGGEKRSLKLQMNKLGLLEETLATASDQTPIVAGQIVKFVGSVAGSVIGLGSALDSAGGPPEDLKDLLQWAAIHDTKNAEAIQSKLGDLYNTRKETVKRVEDLLESLQGKGITIDKLAGVRADTLKHVLETIERPAHKLVGHFLTSKTKSYKVSPPSYLPVVFHTGLALAKQSASGHTLFRFSERHGIDMAHESLRVDPDVLATGAPGTAPGWWSVKAHVLRIHKHPLFADVVKKAIAMAPPAGVPSFRYALRLLGSATAPQNSANKIVGFRARISLTPTE